MEKESTANTTADWSGATSTYAQVVDTGETDFGSQADVFIDIAVPLAELFPGTTFTTTDTFRVAITTSTTHSGINKEIPGSLSDTDDVANGWGDAFAAADVSVPEPGTWALFGLGLTLLAVRTRRRRRQDSPSQST